MKFVLIYIFMGNCGIPFFLHDCYKASVIDEQYTSKTDCEKNAAAWNTISTGSQFFCVEAKP